MTRTTKHPTAPRETLGQRITAARASIDVKATWLALAAQMSPERLADLEGGADIQPAELVQLAELLGRTVRELEQGPLSVLTEDAARKARWRVSKRQGGRKVTTEDPVERAAISRNIRIYRESMGLSQSEVARKLGIASASVVNTHESGLKGVSGANLIAYAELFGCTVEDLKRPAVVVVRTKLSGDVADLSPERRAAIEREIQDFDQRVNARLLQELDAAHKRRRR